jgi:hypothetical protein
MSQHPANLVLRFFLEIVALVSIGQWGWRLTGGPLRWVLALGIPVLVAAVWAIFKAPDDSAVSGKVVVPVPGRVRLSIELAFFGFAIWTMFAGGKMLLGLAFLVAIILHYLWSMDRVTRLLGQ